MRGSLIRSPGAPHTEVIEDEPHGQQHTELIADEPHRQQHTEVIADEPHRQQHTEVIADEPRYSLRRMPAHCASGQSPCVQRSDA
ncbi:MAG: hypothetical protein C0606_07085 [Hyphomicrobiales bacterium]|nr:MAG: hypothetical protein C0606_07085 [Hyphomicrobiales bacterium]